MDPVEKVKELQETLGTGITLLSDSEGKAIEAFSMIDPSPFPPRLVARSGTFVIDAEGKVREALFGGSYRERPDPEAILRLLR